MMAVGETRVHGAPHEAQLEVERWTQTPQGRVPLAELYLHPLYCLSHLRHAVSQLSHLACPSHRAPQILYESPRHPGSCRRIAVSLRQVRQSMAGGQSDAPRRPVSTVGGTAYALSRALGHSVPTLPAYWVRGRAVGPPYRLHSRGRTLRPRSQASQ